MKVNDHFTISVIDSWGTHSDTNNKPGPILLSTAVCVDIMMLQKIMREQVDAVLLLQTRNPVTIS